MSNEATGTLVDRTVSPPRWFAWNWNVDDRAAARAAFERAAAGTFLAVAFDSTTTRKGVRVSTFEEVEKIEARTGTVVVEVTRPLVGG